jgi:hypothetical protein
MSVPSNGTPNRDAILPASCGFELPLKNRTSPAEIEPSVILTPFKQYKLFYLF